MSYNITYIYIINTYVHLNGYVDGYTLDDGLRSGPKKSDSTQLNEATENGDGGR